MPVGEKVRELIQEQGNLWEQAVDIVDRFVEPPPFLLVGSGTSYYLAQVAARVARNLGIAAEAASTGDVVLEPDLWLPKVGTLIVITRSGETSEAVWALKLAEQFGKPSVAVVCGRGTSAERVSRRTICLEGADDDTVVMIRSFTSMLIALQATWAKQKGSDVLPLKSMAAQLPVVLERAANVWKEIADGVRRVYILGAGVRYGIAAEGALKIQEMSGRAAFAYSPFEFRHGPRGAVDYDDIVVVLGQEAWSHDEQLVLTDMALQTERLVGIAKEPWFAGADARIRGRIVLPREVSDLWLGPLAIVPLQKLAWKLACDNSRDPDRPKNLTKVVEFSRG